MTRITPRAIGLIAAVQAVLRIGPLIIEAIGGRGLPTPGSFNAPAQALATIRHSPEVMIVAGLICATGVLQVFIVLAAADRLADTAPQWARFSMPFGIAAASFLMIDGALGMTALSQLAHVTVNQNAVDGAYLAVLGVRNGIDRVIPLTLGLWAMGTNVPAWRYHLLPRTLAAIGSLLGLTGIIGSVAPAAGLASLVLAIAWTAGFAIVLLHGDSDAAEPETAVQQGLTQGP
ncbi:MAG TPA: hypothetical protein VFW65_37270 [Pseudonocardiaceae bacterium]|nr:hypothetical protein [Pseudonocardiaceae bacterium]